MNRRALWLALWPLAAAADPLTVVNFGGANGGAQRLAYIEPFRQAGDVQPTVVEYNGEMAKLKAMVDARRVAWDVLEIESTDLARACEDGLLERLPAPPGGAAAFLPAAVQECGFGAFVWSTALAYHAQRVRGRAPAGWADFWDLRAFPGKRGLRKGARGNLEIALMADGVAADQVYPLLATSAGVARAFRKLDQIKGAIQWWEAGAQPAQFLVGGDVVMSSAFNGRIDAAQREGKPLRLVWQQSLYDLDYWAIPKGAPHAASAARFIAFASSCASQQRYAELIAYGPVNLCAARQLAPARQARLPTAPANLQHALRQDAAFWLEHGEELEQRFTAWATR